MIRDLLILLFILLSSTSLADHHEEFLGTFLSTCFSEDDKKKLHFVISNSDEHNSSITVFQEIPDIEFIHEASATPKEVIWQHTFAKGKSNFSISCIDSNYFAFTSTNDYLNYFVDIENNRIFSFPDDYFSYLTQVFQVSNTVYAVYGQKIFRGGGVYIIDLDKREILDSLDSSIGFGAYLFGVRNNKYLTAQRDSFPEEFGHDVRLHVTELSENNQLINRGYCATSIKILVYNWSELLSEQNLENPEIIFSPKGNTQPSINIFQTAPQSGKSAPQQKPEITSSNKEDNIATYSDSQKQSVLACTELLNSYF